ncbi:17050_t:CDS:1, partial [Dentiscutata heterogama]
MASQRPRKLERISAQQLQDFLKRTSVSVHSQSVSVPLQSGTLPVAAQPSGSIGSTSHFAQRTSD